MTLTETNPLGVKGVGELGTSGPPAAIGNAIRAPLPQEQAVGGVVGLLPVVVPNLL